MHISLSFVMVVMCWTVLIAQEISPRRWTHLPVNATFVAPGMAFSEGDVFFDPVLRAEDVKLESWTTLLAVSHSFAVANQTARVDVIPSWNEESWTGIVDGQDRSLSRSGFRDLILRFSYNFIGAPALSGKEYVAYRQRGVPQTVAGAGVNIIAPTGQYDQDRLINIGANRWSIRPQIGVTHTQGNWSVECTGAIWFYTDNDAFFGDTTREQDSLFALQGHLVYFFRPGAWIAGSAAWGESGENTVGGESKNDEAGNLLWSLRAGFPLTRKTGITLGHLSTDSRTDTGADVHSVLVTLSRAIF
jgi:hypothetical protein